LAFRAWRSALSNESPHSRARHYECRRSAAGHGILFLIASISKTFAATAIMRLVEQGKIDLRAPVRTYLPDFRVRDDRESRRHRLASDAPRRMGRAGVWS
jgi:CubicO group peptidase (beta-lactamase class C family)